MPPDEDWCPRCDSHIYKSGEQEAGEWMLWKEECKCGTFIERSCTCWGCSRSYYLQNNPDSRSDGEKDPECVRKWKHEFPKESPIV